MSATKVMFATEMEQFANITLVADTVAGQWGETVQGAPEHVASGSNLCARRLANPTDLHNPVTSILD